MIEHPPMSQLQDEYVRIEKRYNKAKRTIDKFRFIVVSLRLYESAENVIRLTVRFDKDSVNNRSSNFMYLTKERMYSEADGQQF